MFGVWVELFTCAVAFNVSFEAWTVGAGVVLFSSPFNCSQIRRIKNLNL